MSLRSSPSSQHSWAALVLAGSLFCTGSALAQRDDYKVAPGRDKSYDLLPGEKARDASEKKGKVRALRNSAIEILKMDAGAPLPEDKGKEPDKWYSTYEFPILTLYDPAELQGLPETKTELYEGRKRLFRDQLEKATNVAAHDRLVALAFKFFSEVAKDDYHPAVRYNAMLIVGELNDRELNRAGTLSIPPHPLRAALDFMIKEYNDPKQLDTVRLAALLGIQRHVQLDAQAETAVPADLIPQTELQEIRTLALDLVRTREAPATRTQDGHDWMRRRGLEILSWLAAGKLDQEIVDLVVERLADPEEHRGVRCEAALAINTMKYLPEPGKPRLGSTPVKLDPRKVAADLVQFVIDSATADVDRVNKYLTSLQQSEEIYGTGGGGGGMGGGYGPRGMKGQGGGPPPRSSNAASAGSKGGPPPRSSSSGSAGMKGGPPAMSGGAGAFGGYGEVVAVDPYAFRIEPVYRKLRYEIGCAMQGLRGTDEWRRGDGIGGLCKLFPKSPAEADPAKKGDPKLAGDKEFLETAADALRTLANKLKVKTEELQTSEFVVEKLPLQALNDVVKKVAVKARPAKATKPEPEVKDPLEEPDPADDLPKAEKPENPAPKPKAKPADPTDEEPTE